MEEDSVEGCGEEKVKGKLAADDMDRIALAVASARTAETAGKWGDEVDVTADGGDGDDA